MHRIASRRFLIGLAAVAAAAVALAPWLHSYLAHTAANGRGVLVVEGWISERTLSFLPKVFAKGDYSRVLLIAHPLRRERLALSLALLQRQCALKGIPPPCAVVVTQESRDSSPIVQQGPDAAAGDLLPSLPYRTHLAARTAKHWLEREKITSGAVDVYTVGVHARKSWVYFRHVLGPRYTVGIISGYDPSVHARFWFASPLGLYLVSRNTLGLTYAFLWSIFNPTGETGAV